MTSYRNIVSIFYVLLTPAKATSALYKMFLMLLLKVEQKNKNIVGEGAYSPHIPGVHCMSHKSTHFIICVCVQLTCKLLYKMLKYLRNSKWFFVLK